MDKIIVFFPNPVVIVTMKSILLSCCLFFLINNSKAQIDTIIVHLDSTCQDSTYSGIMPKRVHRSVASKTGSSYDYKDSIRVYCTVIDGFNKNYYLIVYGRDGTKYLEGNFFDEFANGHVINYDNKGRLTSEGDYEIKGRGKGRHSVLTGTWKYYNTKGKILRYEKH